VNEQERTTYWWRRAKNAEARLERIRKYTEETKPEYMNMDYIVFVAKGEM